MAAILCQTQSSLLLAGGSLIPSCFPQWKKPIVSRIHRDRVQAVLTGISYSTAGHRPLPVLASKAPPPRKGGNPPPQPQEGARPWETGYLRLTPGNLEAPLQTQKKRGNGEQVKRDDMQRSETIVCHEEDSMFRHVYKSIEPGQASTRKRKQPVRSGKLVPERWRAVQEELNKSKREKKRDALQKMAQEKLEMGLELRKEVEQRLSIKLAEAPRFADSAKEETAGPEQGTEGRERAQGRKGEVAVARENDPSRGLKESKAAGPARGERGQQMAAAKVRCDRELEENEDMDDIAAWEELFGQR